MRRLAYSLSALLAATTLLTVLAMGGLVAWNLKRGFSDYLEARELDRLRRFAEVLEGRLAGAGAAQDVSWPRELRQALRTYGQSESAGAAGLGPGPGAGPASEGMPPGPRGAGPGGDPGVRPLPGGPDGFGARMSLVSPDGRPLAARPLPLGVAFLEVPIRVDGQTVALARLRKPAATPDALDARFVARQYAGIGIAACVLLLVAGVAGHFVAARWVAPLLAVQRSTHDIAQGRPHRALDESRRDEIGDLMRDVNRMSGSLQRLENARRRWLAEISHELRTPLTVLRGELEALIDGVRPLTPDAVGSLHQESLRLSRLLDDLHTLAMSDLGGMPTHPLEVEPLALVEGAARRMTEAATRAHHALVVELQTGVEGLVAIWDPQRIDQLLDNLLSNAIRYTHAPGRIVLRAAREARGVVIEVEDSAPGVSDEALVQLFEPLFRADPARSGEGSGLGLAIAKAIVQAHGGRIEARHAGLGGVHMRVVLPLEPAGGSS
jgi:two-component system, OmpR family, sensor histidine kinase BaeS